MIAAATRGFRRGWHRGLARSWRWQLDMIAKRGKADPAFLAHWFVKIQREQMKADALKGKQ